MNNLNEAVKIALKAHKGQKDKAGEEYILHPLYLMDQCKDNEHRIVALLHDVVEDTEITLGELRVYFTEDIINAIDCLTHRSGVPYFEYINEIKTNKLALDIKKLDLLHNMDLSRLKVVTEKDKQRVEKYKKAYCLLCDIEEMIF